MAHYLLLNCLSAAPPCLPVWGQVMRTHQAGCSCCFTFVDFRSITEPSIDSTWCFDWPSRCQAEIFSLAEPLKWNYRTSIEQRTHKIRKFIVCKSICNKVSCLRKTDWLKILKIVMSFPPPFSRPVFSLCLSFAGGTFQSLRLTVSFKNYLNYAKYRMSMQVIFLLSVAPASYQMRRQMETCFGCH